MCSSLQPEVRSHAADWTALSSLDELRAAEEEGDLGDFSVFGTQLREVDQVCTVNGHTVCTVVHIVNWTILHLTKLIPLQ